MSRPLRVAVKDHFGKARRLGEALAAAGHRLAAADERADALLIDFDAPLFGYADLIDRYKSMGATVLMYPHGAGPPVQYDGQFEPSRHVDANLVIAPGYAEVLRRMEYPRPTHVIGWSLCEQRAFRPAAAVRRVVFAPVHPSGFGVLPDYFRDQNAEVFARLLEGGWELTVRHIGTLEQNGLWEAPGVRYVTGDYQLSVAEMDAADAVVAGEGTYPSVAVARGVPTVVYAQMTPSTYGLPGEAAVPLRRLDRYRDYHRFPFDALEGPLDEVLHAAARSDAPIAEWKRRHVGAPLDPARFARLVERLVREPAARVELDPTRAFTVVGFADEVHERPELLAAYAEAFTPADDATLVLWGPGFDADGLLETVERALAASGVADDRLPDVLLLPLPGSPGADRRLAERAQAVLSEWPGCGRLGELPRYGARDAAALRAAAGQPARDPVTA